MEILIVLALIGIVAGLAMTNLGEILVVGKRKRQKLGLTVQEKLMSRVFAMVGEYPKSLNDLQFHPMVSL